MNDLRPGLYQGLLVRRPLAYLADLVILSILGTILWLTLSLLSVLTLGLLLPLQAAILALLPLAYHSLFIAGFSATPGMALLDLRIVAEDGGGVGLAQAVIATIVFYVSMALSSGLILLVCLFSARSRTLHDMLSGTQALRASARGSGPRSRVASNARLM